MKKILLMLIIYTGVLQAVQSEELYFFTRMSGFNAQFWERQDSDSRSFDDRKIFSNFTGGSFGAGMEFVLWDMGVTRGSRLFLRYGIDMTFLAPNYLGITNDGMSYSSVEQVSLGNGAFYMGLSNDFYIGGTLPKTNFIWGLGTKFFFVYPVYTGGVTFDRDEQFAFFAAPSLLLGYDIMIPNTYYKITPGLKVGFTCDPLIPNAYFPDMGKYDGSAAENWYSGLYVELSVSVSVFGIKWKK